MTSINQPSLRMIISLLLLLLATVSFSSSVLSQTNPCDANWVSIDVNGDFLVSPSMDMTGVTDTTNLQCANDAVASDNFHAINLKQGTFYIEDITLDCPSSKSCTFAGHTRASTTLEVLDDSIDCKGNYDNGVVRGGLNFMGNVTVQHMTVRGDSPCMADEEYLPGLMVFTGAPAVMGESCPNSVLFANLNRVDITADSHDIDAGVVVFPQGRYLGEPYCQDVLSGSFTSTRTTIDGPFTGLGLSMQAGSRIGLDFLENRNSASGVVIVDSNAVTEVNFCEITGVATEEIDFWGIAVVRNPSAPQSTTTNINKCTFDLMSDPGAFAAIGVNVQDFDPPSSMPTVISASTFKHMGPDTFGVEFGDVSNCTVTGNDFSGSGGNAIAIFSEIATASGCTVTGNTGLPGFTATYDDIYAGPFTQDNVLGSHPGAEVIDAGCNFDLNDLTGGCALSGGAPVIEKAQMSTEVSMTPRPSRHQAFIRPGQGFKHYRHSLMRSRSAE